MRAQPLPSPWPPGTPRLRVGDVLVDLRYRQVVHGETVTELPQRMFALLQLFLAEPHVLHTRNDLFRRVWGDAVVEDANLSQSVWMLRKALGPQRKDWIRTVAKQGYVFAPPAPVEPLQDDGGTTVPVSAPHDAPTQRATRSWPRFAGWATAAVVVVAAGWFAIVWRGRSHEAVVPANAHATIALLEVHDRAAPGSNWPAKLAHAWLAWKLGSVPDVTLLGESDLAADAGGTPPTVLMLSCASGGPGEVVLRARFDDRNQSPIVVRGPLSRVPQLADALSRQAMARLLPQRRDDRWPALVLGEQAARDYAKAADALERRDWAGSLPVLREIARTSPHFGLAQLQLARAESRLGQAGPANAAMAAARLNLQPLPADAQRLLDAEALAIDPQRNNEAAAAFQALATAYPQRYDFALDQARFLTSAGNALEARAILQRPGWEQRRTGLRISRLLALADVEGVLGDPNGARKYATQALDLAKAAGPGWAAERGSALLVMARADSMQHSSRVDNPLYEQAAKEFEAAGATADALYARVQGALMRPPGPDTAKGVDTLLAKAHAEGYRQVEIELLRAVAFQHYQAGQQEAYRDLLEQALAAAREAGDVMQQRLLDLDLLNEDFLRADFASAGRRIARLRHAGLQGDAAAWVDQFESIIAAARGQYTQALATLDTGERRQRGAPPLTVARTACSRADLLQLQGHLQRARGEWTRCAAPDQDMLRMQARMGRASNDLLAGDRVAALQALRAIAAQTRDELNGPDQWQMAVALAPLLIRAGDLELAQQLLQPVVPPSRQAGYGWIIAQAEASLAEIDAARGHWESSRAHAQAARRAAPPDLWLVTSRLDDIAIADALAQGDRNRAETLLAQSDANAHRHGDAVAQLELHGLMSSSARLPSGCDATQRKALAARTGMRGASLDWLFGPLVERNPLWHAAGER